MKRGQTSPTEEDEGNPQLEALGGRTTAWFAEGGGKTNLPLPVVVVKRSPEVAAALDGWRRAGATAWTASPNAWKA